MLPGIVIAYLLTGDRAPIPMVIGAGALGVLTVFLVELFHRTRRLKEDASIGVVFPALFSIGVIMISRYAGAVDLDLDCVLYGEIAYAPLDVLEIGSRTLRRQGAVDQRRDPARSTSRSSLACYKELKLSTFDRALAATLGFSPLAAALPADERGLRSRSSGRSNPSARSSCWRCWSCRRRPPTC